MAKKLISYDDEAEGMGLPDVVEEGLNATYVPLGMGSGLLSGWQGMPIQRHWQGWINYIDGSDIAPAATKVQIGTAPDTTGGTVPLWAYRAGRVDAPHFLLTSGMHGHEVLPPAGAFRWFEAFTTSTDPVFADLRKRVQVTWVPLINPVNYRAAHNADMGIRENPNGVDLNRNWDQDWGIEPSAKKGSAPFSESETQALRDYIDTTNVAGVLDLHTQGSTIYGDIALGSAGPHTGADPSVVEAARYRIAEMMRDTPHNVSDYPGRPMSTFRGWAGRYLRWTKGHGNAMASIIECYPTLGGSDGWRFTDTGAHLLCNSIHAVITEWASSHRLNPPRWADIYAERSDTSPSNDILPISEGGRLIDTTIAPVTFNSGHNHIAIPVVGPGRYTLHWEARIYPQGAGGRVSSRGALAPMPTTGNLTSQPETTSPIDLPDEGSTVPIRGEVSYDVTELGGNSLLMGQVFVFFVTGTIQARLNRRPSLLVHVTYSPRIGSTFPPVEGYSRRSPEGGD